MDSGNRSVELMKTSSADGIFEKRVLLPLHQAECLHCFPAQ